MKTPLQEVFAHLRASKETDNFGEVYCVDWLLENEKSLLEKEKFGGIQWKPYNLDNLPPVESFQGLILFKSGHMEIATWIVRDEEPGYDWYWPSAYGGARQEDITHWAHINQPNH